MNDTKKIARSVGVLMLAAFPGGLFEIFFAIWLIARGFSTVRLTVAARA
ncbi:MAG: hypothetical protein JWP85_2598 [Rhodoglobus sp.]|nr:hypothetical protein [Rhodoglobus sp.]